MKRRAAWLHLCLCWCLLLLLWWWWWWWCADDCELRRLPRPPRRRPHEDCGISPRTRIRTAVSDIIVAVEPNTKAEGLCVYVCGCVCVRCVLRGCVMTQVYDEQLV
ncbi:hypothetical protein ABB37_08614 [Leptomonas pyrrhocoris]|uniref:Uncharacterized protein n=1 Tax=Leptomonas pyrrhocoris TaxID=157538 RepID=A0A0M9FSW8_LEPPY|nr:hypothetical protein ABB37_08614 [Leptomonas pyrrhocoris]KPA75317.1 hypothetical protein ABB37_08614 [Leptomonas pyrrhocoris]|eukprot:XP_015653756.1 hypothetical protein ABB37_08614 [Leptomonas pyrrhocoris]